MAWRPDWRLGELVCHIIYHHQWLERADHQDYRTTVQVSQRSALMMIGWRNWGAIYVCSQFTQILGASWIAGKMSVLI